MSSHAQQLAALVDGDPLKERSNLAFRKDFASQTKSLFESFGAPLAGLSDAPFADVLSTMAAFPTYSLGNQTLIALQSPRSSTLSSAERWADLGRRLVRNAQPVHIWAPADSRTNSERSVSGFARPTLEKAEQIAFSLGLRATTGGEFLFDAHAISQHPLWGSLQTWRNVRAVRIADGGDHIAIRLITRDGRALDRRARTMVGLVKSLMQSGSSPNDETITEYLTRGTVTAEAQGSKRARDFFQKFKMVPVYDVAETDGPDLPEVPQVDLAQALADLRVYLEAQRIGVIVSASSHAVHASGDTASIYIEEKLDVAAQLQSLLHASADVLSQRQADAQNRELLKSERDAIKYVLSMHFDLPCSAPELGRGLAPDVEPHAAAEVVKARLVSVHDIAKQIVLGARPGYENSLLKALSTSKQKSSEIAPVTPPEPEAIKAAPTPALPPAKQIIAPKPKVVRAKRGRAKEATSPIEPALVEPKIDALKTVAASAPEEFNPFAPAVSDETDFNPFA